MFTWFLNAHAKKYYALCTHPMCNGKDAAGNDCPHRTPHAYFEEECDEIFCGRLEGPSSCDIVFTIDEGKSYTIVPYPKDLPLQP